MGKGHSERLEIRLPSDMMQQLREIAPRDRSGRPNVSSLVRSAIGREIERHTVQRMVEWAGRHRRAIRQLQEEWDGTASDGIA